jgi:hypothetical protein
MTGLKIWPVVKTILYELQPVRLVDLISFARYLHRSATVLGSFSLLVSDLLYQRSFDIARGVKLRTWIFTATWAAGLLIMIKAGFGSVWILLSLISSIFLNLGKRKRGELSAYSVFNEGFKQLLGTMNADQLDDEIRHNGRQGRRQVHDIVQLDDVLEGVDEWDDIPAPRNNRIRRQHNPQNNNNNPDNDQNGAVGDGEQRAGRAAGERARKKGKKARRTYEERMQRRRQQQEQPEVEGDVDGSDGEADGWEAHGHLLQD